jgi:hypothetical protein
VRRRVRVKGLRDALRDEDERDDDRERQQDVDDRPVEVAPEVAQRVRRPARDAAHDRNEDRHADAGRDEVLHGEAGHLRQVGHRGLAAVVLPVRVRHEARRRVERDVRRHGRQVVGVQEEVSLQPLDSVQDDREQDGEDDHGHPVRLPVLLCVAHEQPLDAVVPACIDPRQVAAQRRRENDQDDRVEDDLAGARELHQNFSPRTSA